MAKFVIECPSCGRYAEASTGFFAKKKIACACGYTINVKTDKLASKVCPFCGNTVVYDQSEGEDAKCPVCHEKINTRESMAALTEFTCPSCSCKISFLYLFGNGGSVWHVAVQMGSVTSMSASLGGLFKAAVSVAVFTCYTCVSAPAEVYYIS